MSFSVVERVVVGFEEKVYMVEEGQARLELPVVVKEGLLTQRVTLLITIADRTTTGNTIIHITFIW